MKVLEKTRQSSDWRVEEMRRLLTNLGNPPYRRQVLLHLVRHAIRWLAETRSGSHDT